MSWNLINKRGRIIIVHTEDEVEKLQKQGFVIAPVDQTGDYNPIYDKGEEEHAKEMEIRPVPTTSIPSKGDILAVESI